MNTAISGIPDASEIHSATETILAAKRLWAAERVLNCVVENAEKALLAKPDDEDLRLYGEFEAERVSRLERRFETLLRETVIPMAVRYVRDRFPERAGEEFPRFDNLYFGVLHTASGLENVLTGELPDSGRLLWGCGMREVEDGLVLEVTVNLDSFFKEFESFDIEDAEFNDFAEQVLLHEVMHALSSHTYLRTPKEREARARWLLLANDSENAAGPVWDSLVSRFGYSVNMATPAMTADEMLLANFPVMDLFNEALTDILAARAYSFAHKTRDGVEYPYEYCVSYGSAASAFYKAVREYSEVRGRKFKDVFREIEEGYFFGDVEFLKAFEEIVWPCLAAHQDYLLLADRIKFGIRRETDSIRA